MRALRNEVSPLWLVIAALIFAVCPGCSGDDVHAKKALRELCDNYAGQLGADVWVLRQLGHSPDWFSVKARSPDTPWELRNIHESIVTAVDPKADADSARASAKQVCYRHFRL